MKKFLIMLMVFSLAALSGCEATPEDAASAVSRALKELNKKSRVEMSSDMEIKAVVSGTDYYGDTFSNREIAMNQSMSMICASKQKMIYTKGQLTQNIDGEEFSSDTESYILEEDGQSVMYSSYDGQWIRMNASETLPQVVVNILTSISKKDTEAEYDDSDENVCLIKANVKDTDTESLVSVVKSVLGVTDAHVDDAASQVIVELDKKSWLPKSISVDMKEYANAVIASTDDLEGDFSDCIWNISYTSYQKGNAVTLPEEVKNNAFDMVFSESDMQGDHLIIEEQQQTMPDVKPDSEGQYKVSKDNVSIFVKALDGYELTDYADHFAYFENGSGASVLYQFVDGYDPKTVIDEYVKSMTSPQVYEKQEFSEVKTQKKDNLDISYIVLDYVNFDKKQCIDYFISIPVDKHLLNCQICGLEAEDEEFLEQVLSNIVFK